MHELAGHCESAPARAYGGRLQNMRKIVPAVQLARHYETYLAGEVLAVSVAYAANGTGETASIEGRELRISVARAG